MSREFYVQPACQPQYAPYPMRSRLSFLGKWRRARASDAKPARVAAAKGPASSSSSSLVTIDDQFRRALPEAARNTPSSETNLSRIASQQENRPASAAIAMPLPTNLIEANLVSSSFDPAMSSLSTTNAMPSFHTDEQFNEDTEVNATISNETTGSVNNNDERSDVTMENPEDELNRVDDEGPFAIPSAVIGTQIRAPNMGARFLFDVVPIAYSSRSSSLNSAVSNSRSNTATEEDSYESATSGTTESNAESSVGSSSADNSVIEILAAIDPTGRRFQDDCVRPYYDARVKPKLRKHFHSMEDDPPIY